MGCCSKKNQYTSYVVDGVHVKEIIADSISVPKNSGCCGVNVDVFSDGQSILDRAFDIPHSRQQYGDLDNCGIKHNVLFKNKNGIVFNVGASNNYSTGVYVPTFYSPDCTYPDKCIGDFGFTPSIDVRVNGNSASGYPKVLNNKVNWKYGGNTAQLLIGNCGCGTSTVGYTVAWDQVFPKYSGVPPVKSDKIEVVIIPDNNGYPLFLSVEDGHPAEYYSKDSSYQYIPCGTFVKFIEASLEETVVDEFDWPNTPCQTSKGCFVNSPDTVTIPDFSQADPPPNSYTINISFNYKGASLGPEVYYPFPFCGTVIDPLPKGADPNAPEIKRGLEIKNQIVKYLLNPISIKVTFPEGSDPIYAYKGFGGEGGSVTIQDSYCKDVKYIFKTTVGGRIGRNIDFYNNEDGCFKDLSVERYSYGAYVVINFTDISGLFFYGACAQGYNYGYGSFRSSSCYNNLGDNLNTRIPVGFCLPPAFPFQAPSRHTVFIDLTTSVTITQN